MTEALYLCSEWSDSDTSRSASKLLRSISSKDFVVCLVTIDFFLTKLVETAKLFQKANVDIVQASQSLQEIINYFQGLNIDNISRDLIHQANEVHRGVNLYSGFMYNRNMTTPNQYCSIKILKPILDGFLATVKSKFTDREFDFFHHLVNIETIGEEKILRTASDFKFILDPHCEASFYIKLFVEQLNKMKALKISRSSSFLKVASQTKHLPYISKLFTVGATIWVSSNSAERSFSLLNLVKSSLRTNMSQQRLSDIAIIATNSEVKVSYESIIEEFCAKERRLDFGS